MRTLRLVVEYDGTDFVGWQRQREGRTVQGCLEAAFAAMVGQPVRVKGAGRTDAGVHAEGQVAAADVEVSIPVLGFCKGLNGHLPLDIAVLSVEDAEPGFDPRRTSRGKVYRYTIWNHPVRSPLRARTSWHVRGPLDVDRMRAAAALLIGEHDFRGFRAADCGRLSTQRTIRRITITRGGALLAIEVEGTAFLKNMVRIIAGTLVAVGRGALTLDDVRTVLTGGDRTLAGETAPPQGLTLVRVIF